MKRILQILGIILGIFLIVYLINLGKNLSITIMIEEEYEKTHYINDLYNSKEINYRLALNNNERKLYDEIITHINNFDTEFVVDLSGFRAKEIYGSFKKISDVMQTIGMDHPELIQYGSSSFSKRKNDTSATINITYTMTKEEYNVRVNEIKTIIEETKKNTEKMTEYEKVKYVYDYLGRKNSYGNPSDINGQSAYSAFSDTLSPVCAGYAKASQILFQNIGINSLLIFGDAKYNLFIGDAHAWNNVQIDGAYYLYDVTYSSNGKDKSDEEFYIGFLTKDKSNYSPWYKKSSAFINGIKHQNKNT
ncbi:MAG: hypothetical protein J6C28_00595 [Bacilli bacterium]|nr:hypothetical protein [Bacilli bacterium]